MPSVVQRYDQWNKRRRALKEARLLLREARRALRKYAHRVSDKQAALVREAAERLAAVVKSEGESGDEVRQALNALDKALDDYMPFARKSTIREYAESIAVAVLIALFLRAFVVEAFKIPSGSMIPTLEVGDHIFVNKFIYGVRIPWTNIKFGKSYRKPERGEVIVFIYPRDPDKDFIKRIVAIEGDVVEVRDNVLYVNGKAVERRKIAGDCEYTDFDEQSQMWTPERCDRYVETLDGRSYTTFFDRASPAKSWPPQTVPRESVFVMGDNRDHSSDSRYWGFVPLDLIKGKAMVIWWSQGEPRDGPGTWNSVRYGRMFHLVR
jgi:signal peptidase I